MDKPCLYVVRVEGHLDESWSDWFDGLEINRELDGITALSGLIPDQCALFGLLGKVRDLNLNLLSVNRIEDLPQDT